MLSQQHEPDLPSPSLRSSIVAVTRPGYSIEDEMGLCEIG
jgi:hypothetical protein